MKYILLALAALLFGSKKKTQIVTVDFSNASNVSVSFTNESNGQVVAMLDGAYGEIQEFSAPANATYKITVTVLNSEPSYCLFTLEDGAGLYLSVRDKESGETNVAVNQNLQSLYSFQVDCR